MMNPSPTTHTHTHRRCPKWGKAAQLLATAVGDAPTLENVPYRNPHCDVPHGDRPHADVPHTQDSISPLRITTSRFRLISFGNIFFCFSVRNILLIISKCNNICTTFSLPPTDTYEQSVASFLSKT